MEVKNVTKKLQEMAVAITGPLVMEDLVKKAVTVCKDIIKADACSIFLIDSKNPEDLIMRASVGYKNDLTSIAKYRLKKDSPDEKLGLTADIAITGNPFVTESRDGFKISHEYSGGKYDESLWGKEDKEKCQSFFGAPLKTADRIFGVFKVESQKENFFNEERQDILLIIANMITSSLQNLRVIRLFHESFKEIGESPTETKKLYNALAEKCAELVHAEACSIFILNESERLVLRGDYGHPVSLVDREEDEYTYASGEGVTGTVFKEGKPDSARSKEEVKSYSYHKSKLYPIQWNDKDHICHSWYQFPLGKHGARLGVMKVENKLGIYNKPIVQGGFNESEKDILEIFANSVVPLIVAAEIKKRADRAHATLDRIGWTTNIDEIFSPDLLSQIEGLKGIQNKQLHDKIIDFINEVKHLSKGERDANYLDIAKGHIYKIGNVLKIDKGFIEFCEPLEFYEPILYQLHGYRAHFVHQLNVFLNGYLILNWLEKRQFKKIKKIIAKKCKVKEKSIDILKIWFITTIFHDTGYPLGKFGEVTNELMGKIFQDKEKSKDKDLARPIIEALSFRLYRGLCRESLNLLIQHLSTWLRLSENKQVRLRQEIHEHFFTSLSENLIPGILLIRAADKLLKPYKSKKNTNIDESSKIKECDLSTAISAISLDDEDMTKCLDEKGLRKQLSFTDHPLAFLLVYCDEIQEHGRPKSDLSDQNDEGKNGIPKIDEFAVKRQELTYQNANKIHCKLTYNKKPDIWDKEDKLSKKTVKKRLENIINYWQSPSDLTFIIECFFKNEGQTYTFTFSKGKIRSW